MWLDMASEQKEVRSVETRQEPRGEAEAAEEPVEDLPF